MPVLTYDMNGGTFAPPPQTLDSGVAGTITDTAASRTVSITFDANGGTFVGSSSTLANTYEVTTFDWATTPDGASAYSAGDSITIAEDTTLYAVWPIYLVTLMSLPVEGLESGDIIERLGYRLEPNSHWTVTQNGTDPVPSPWRVTSDYLTNNAVTVYAKWQYRVNIHLRGGFSLAGPPYLINSGCEYVGGADGNLYENADSRNFITIMYPPDHGSVTPVQIRYLPELGDVVIRVESGHPGAVFYNTGTVWKTPQIPLTFVYSGHQSEFPTGMTTSGIWVTNVVPGSELENLVVALDYNASGWDRVELTLGPETRTIKFTPRGGGSLYNIIQGEVNLSTGTITSVTYELLVEMPSDWEDGYSNYYVRTGSNTYEPNEEADWSVAYPEGVYEQVATELLIEIPHIEIPDGVTDFVPSANTGDILGVQYYTNIRDEGSIIADPGHLGQLHLWKTHGQPLVSPFTFIPPTPGDVDTPYGFALNLSKDGYNAIRFATSEERADYLEEYPDDIDPAVDPQIHFTYNVDEPVEYYTVWYVQRFTITFRYGYKSGDQDIINVQHVTAGGSAIPPDDPYRTGYVFTGWDGTYTEVDSDADVIAQWRSGHSPIWIRDNGIWVEYDPN